MLCDKVNNNYSYCMILHIVPPKKTGKTHNMLNQFHHTYGVLHFNLIILHLKRIVFHTDRHHIKMAIFLRDSFLSNINTQNILYYDQNNQI